MARYARIIAGAAAKPVGSGSQGVVIPTEITDTPVMEAIAEGCAKLSCRVLTPFLLVPANRSIKQVAELHQGGRHRGAGHRWPDKAATLQPHQEHTPNFAIMPNKLDQIAAGLEKDKQILWEERASDNPGPAEGGIKDLIMSA